MVPTVFTVLETYSKNILGRGKIHYYAEMWIISVCQKCCFRVKNQNSSITSAWKNELIWSSFCGEIETGLL